MVGLTPLSVGWTRICLRSNQNTRRIATSDTIRTIHHVESLSSFIIEMIRKVSATKCYQNSDNGCAPTLLLKSALPVGDLAVSTRAIYHDSDSSGPHGTDYVTS